MRRRFVSSLPVYKLSSCSASSPISSYHRDKCAKATGNIDSRASFVVIYISITRCTVTARSEPVVKVSKYVTLEKFRVNRRNSRLCTLGFPYDYHPRIIYSEKYAPNEDAVARFQTIAAIRKLHKPVAGV